MKPVKTWIIVADGSRARALENTGPGMGLEMVGEELFSAHNEPTRELGTDRPGRVHDRKGTGRHAMEPRADWHVFEKTQFARRVAGLLNKAALENWFDRLVLIAPAKTLGDLRTVLNDHARGRIISELVQDYTHLNLSELEEHLETRIIL